MSSYPTEKMHLTTSEIDGVSAELDNSIELEQTLSLPMSILMCWMSVPLFWMSSLLETSYLH